MKKLILIFVMTFSILLPALAKQNFEIRYLMKKLKNYDIAGFSVYENDKLISDLATLQNRKIFGIRFDKKEKDCVLFAEKKGDSYILVRLNFLTEGESVLFSFERANCEFLAYTEDSFFWFERTENDSEPYILYEYDSRTKEIKNRFTVKNKLRDNSEKLYEHCFIEYACANDESIFFFQYGGIDSANYLVNRKTGEVKKVAEGIVKTAYCPILQDCIPLCTGDAMKCLRFVISKRKSETSKYDFIITDLNTLAETKCKFKKYFEGQGGRLILLSDNYLLVPFKKTPFRDSLRNGLFGFTWTIQYTVFDIAKNKAVFGDFVSRTDELRIVDAILLNEIKR